MISNIRNFAIIAHIDHGKSTLADRLIQITKTILNKKITNQFLDNMEIEKERGITIKAQTVRLNYYYNNNKYILNLIDTPGHVDFSYEVSRSLAACESSLLVVDSTQGVAAQTLANCYQALDYKHTILPVINKIDLPSSDVLQTKNQIKNIIGIDTDHACLISAKTGIGIKDLIKNILNKLPPPIGDINKSLKAMLIDSWYDNYLGVMILVRIINGSINVGDKIKMLYTGAVHNITSIGVMSPTFISINSLYAGDIGIIIGSIKNVSDTKIGDTITSYTNPCKPLPGFKSINPVVFCSLFPKNVKKFNDFKISIEKLRLNDSSFTFEFENSLALGCGFRCGFLGLLHLCFICCQVL